VHILAQPFADACEGVLTWQCADGPETEIFRFVPRRGKWVGAKFMLYARGGKSADFYDFEVN